MREGSSYLSIRFGAFFVLFVVVVVSSSVFANCVNEMQKQGFYIIMICILTEKQCVCECVFKRVHSITIAL